jgi:uncharacterized membrane protein YphA (DoxX/SURF4 family)
MGLLILRVTVAAVVLILESTRVSSGPPSMLSFAAMGSAVLIALGLFTSFASAITAFLIGLMIFTSHSELMFGTMLAALCVALILMGGGAYSIDGLLHGRRRIVLPEA